MFLLDFFKKYHACSHDHIAIDADFAYCPDCGELIANEWYIIRCASCGIKEKAVIKNGEIIPVNNYCHNCGGQEYIIEKLDKINFIDINYAVLVKRVIKSDKKEEFTQCWAENDNKKQMLLQMLR